MEDRYGEEGNYKALKVTLPQTPKGALKLGVFLFKAPLGVWGELTTIHSISI
jgi:hypothetical protein